MKFPSVINSKLPEIGTTIFTVMGKMASEYNAVNLSQGFPDFSCDPELIALVNKHMVNGHNQYAPMQGLMGLREVLAEKTEFLYGAKYNPDTEITITAGATQALYTAITAIIHEDDEVIIFEPAYDSYESAIELAGGKTLYASLKAPSYSVDWNEVKKLINHRTKMIIINTPHNPTGTVMSESDMKQLEALTKGTDIIILSDEVYEHIIFDSQQHQSVARFPGLVERSIIVSSFGKTFHATGWKMGYCVAPENLMKEFRKVHQYIVFCCNTPIQYALAEYLKNKEKYLTLGNYYQEKRDYFAKLIAPSRFDFELSKGTYFQLLRYKNISEEKDTDFAIRLTKENKIASIPVSVFYHEGTDEHVLRFCFAKKDHTLEQAAEILNNI